MEENFDFSPADLSQIYLALSETTNTDYTKQNDDKYLTIIINKKFNENFLQINSEELCANRELLNKTFILFYKTALNNREGFKIYKCFIFYCDYFNLDYKVVYNLLGGRIKNYIENDFIIMVGGFKNYSKIKKKLGVDDNATLFDLT